MGRKRWWPGPTSRDMATASAGALAALQAVLLVLLWRVPIKSPSHLRPLELLWVWLHRPTIYVLIMVLTAGPVLTVLAWRRLGPRRCVVLTWIGAIVAVWVWHRQAVTDIVRVLWSLR